MSRLGLGATLLATSLIASCWSPGGVETPNDLTIAALLSGGAATRLVPFKAGQDDVTFSLAADRAAFMIFNSQQPVASHLSVAIAPQGATTYHVATATGGATESADLPAFEGRLRTWEAPLRERRPAPYKIAQVAQKGYVVGAEESFWVIADLVDGHSTEIQVPARAAYVGEHCYVFVDRQLAESRYAERVAHIGKTFDQSIFPTNSRLFGPPLASGVNGDPRISLLISPVVGNYGKDTTIGYFTLRDLFAPGADPADPVLRHSNQRLMLYMSPFVVSRGQPADYLGTIAHEFQHLINASQKIFKSKGNPKTEDLWLDEGLAMYAMEANGYGLNGDGGVVFDHVAGYLARPGAYSLTDWRNNPGESAYGAVYLFTNYLAERFGEGILAELVGSNQIGLANVQARLATRGTSFRQIFDDWTAANLLDDTGLSAEPRYQYRQLNLLGTYGRRQLYGMHLEQTQLPSNGRIELKAYSARYYVVARGSGGGFRLSLTGDGGTNYGGLVVAQ